MRVTRDEIDQALRTHCPDDEGCTQSCSDCKPLRKYLFRYIGIDAHDYAAWAYLAARQADDLSAEELRERQRYYGLDDGV